MAMVTPRRICRVVDDQLWLRLNPNPIPNTLATVASRRYLSGYYNCDSASIRLRRSYQNCDSTAIRLRFDFDSTTTKNEQVHFFVASKDVVANQKAVGRAYNHDVMVYVTL